MQGLNRLLLSFVLAVALCGAVSNAQSAVTRLEAIDAQPLSNALDEFIQRTGLQLVYVSEIAAGVHSKGARPGLSAQEALRDLLRETGLTFEFLNDRTVSIRPLKTANDGNSEAPAPSQGTDAGAPTPQSARDRDAAEDDEPREDRSERTEIADAQFVMPEILVIGRRILNADIPRTEDDAQPYMVFERDDLERSGARNIEDFLARRLTASTSSTTFDKGEGPVSAPALGNISNINLRGLGSDETLILIDGRRIAGFSNGGAPSQPDINGLPLAAIERIEVLPTTASGIYGGGATGGVINIVLRRDYDGVDLKLTYGSTVDSGGSQRQIDLGAGLSLEDGRTSVLLAASYADTDELWVGDRDLLSRGQERILANNPNVLLGPLPPLGATTNISTTSVGGVRPPLTLDDAVSGGSNVSLGSPITFVPAGYTGAGSDSGAGFIANAGQYNLDLANVAGNGGARQSLLNAPTVKSVNATARREFSSWLDAYLELASSENRAATDSGVNGTFLIAGNAPGNPFQQTIRVTTPILGVDNVVESVLESNRAAAGVIVDLPGNWRAQGDYTWNRTRFSFSQPSFQIDSARITADIASGALNVFRDTNANPIDFSPYLGNDQASDVETTLDAAALRFSGPLPLSLPGGSASLSLLFETRKEKIGDQIGQTAPIPPQPSLDFLIASRSQSVDSAYLELRLPITSEQNAVPGVSLLELQLAGRWDDYETNGADQGVPLVGGVPVVPVLRGTNRFSNTSPTFGLRYEPVPDVMLRGSYGEGFLPANVLQIVPAAAPLLVPSFIFPVLGLTDPRRGGEFVGASLPPTQLVSVFQGGNPDLEPEESQSWSAGLVLKPRFIPGLRLSADWTRTEKTGNIALVNPLQQANLNLELLIPGLVTRDTNPATFGGFQVGPIVAFDARLRNVALTEVEAYDFAVDYRWGSGSFGEFSLSAAATHYAHNETQAVPLAPIVENTGTIIGLPWRGHATLTWDYKNWTAAWTTRHFDSYRLFPEGQENTAVVTTQGSATVPSQTYHDLFASFRFDSQIGLLSGLEMQLGVSNIFNTRPPVDITQPRFFYSTLGDPRLASYHVSLRKTF